VTIQSIVLAKWVNKSFILKSSHTNILREIFQKYQNFYYFQSVVNDNIPVNNSETIANKEVLRTPGKG